ncbi:hypothetical protein R3W88_011842 [Solanum pinnatisectum]|uniref:Uncharacterized protein n=1 Tax=Solanum pinnatisectum TaxID=50273 RepID=A0AAV9LA63_9SOLN|nr:hypothetical protein R3W88_011842 [Solanum pinnatisectum]
MKEEEFICDASSKEIAISDAFSTNYIVATLNKCKRTRSDDDEEEEEEDDDENAIKTICNINKLSRIHEKERQEVHKGQIENQESKLNEEEGGNQGNTNEEGDENEETKEEEEGETKESDEDQNGRGKI